MPKNQPQISLDEYIQNLVDVISEAIEQDEGALKEALAEEGIDYDKLVNDGLQFIHTLEREQRFAIAKEKQERLRFLRETMSNIYEGTKEELLDALRYLFTKEEYAAEFHKFESLELDDLKSILKDAKILELFEKDIKQKKKKND